MRRAQAGHRIHDRARQAGVAGFLTKDRLGTQLVDAILELGSK